MHTPKKNMLNFRLWTGLFQVQVVYQSGPLCCCFIHTYSAFISSMKLIDFQPIRTLRPSLQKGCLPSSKGTVCVCVHVHTYISSFNTENVAPLYPVG